MGVGSYIKGSDYYNELTAEEKVILEPALRVLDNETYRFTDPETGIRQAVQCVNMARLLYFVPGSDMRFNIGGVKVFYPGELLTDTEKYDVNPIYGRTIDQVQKGDVLIYSEHVAVVVAAGNGKVTVLDGNGDERGGAVWYEIKSNEEWQQFIGNGAIIR